MEEININLDQVPTTIVELSKVYTELQDKINEINGKVSGVSSFWESKEASAFIDQLNKLTLIFATRKAANKQEFDCQPYPIINHFNMYLFL